MSLLNTSDIEGQLYSGGWVPAPRTSTVVEPATGGDLPAYPF